MAQSSIIKSWSLREFASAFGKQVSQGKVVNKTSGEEFASVCFTSSGGTQTYATYSSKLGEKSLDYLKTNLNNLQVVQLESGNFKICEKGSGTWDSIDLF